MYAPFDLRLVAIGTRIPRPAQKSTQRRVTTHPTDFGSAFAVAAAVIFAAAVVVAVVVVVVFLSVIPEGNPLLTRSSKLAAQN
jgi:hypothetical protein